MQVEGGGKHKHRPHHKPKGQQQNQQFGGFGGSQTGWNAGQPTTMNPQLSGFGGQQQMGFGGPQQQQPMQNNNFNNGPSRGGGNSRGGGRGYSNGNRGGHSGYQSNNNGGFNRPRPCKYALSGQPCPRSDCKFDHNVTPQVTAQAAFGAAPVAQSGPMGGWGTFSPAPSTVPVSNVPNGVQDTANLFVQEFLQRFVPLQRRLKDLGDLYHPQAELSLHNRKMAANEFLQQISSLGDITQHVISYCDAQPIDTSSFFVHLGGHMSTSAVGTFEVRMVFRLTSSPSGSYVIANNIQCWRQLRQ